MLKPKKMTSMQRKMARDAAFSGSTEIMDSFFECMGSFDESDRCVAPFEKNEISLGRNIGSGAFCDVYEINSINIRQDESRNYTREEVLKREEMAGEARGKYVLKRLKKGLEEMPNFTTCARDIACEAELLSSLDHPNIIKIHGISAARHDSFLDGSDNFFLILERLEETLDKRIIDWANPTKENFAKFPRQKGSSRKRRRITAFINRKNDASDKQIEVASSLADALNYLHQNNIIYRDLKPNNIGFDRYGNVKLFDFGLARVLPSVGDVSTEVFEMSIAGTPRYSSPEVLSFEPYNLKSDVYSFACVVWEILSLKRPYSCYLGREEFLTALLEKKIRPKINSRWPQDIRNFLEASFSVDMKLRPSMTEYPNTLHQCETTDRSASSYANFKTSRNRRSSSSRYKANTKNGVPIGVKISALKLVLVRKLQGGSNCIK